MCVKMSFLKQWNYKTTKETVKDSPVPDQRRTCEISWNSLQVWWRAHAWDRPGT